MSQILNSFGVAAASERPIFTIAYCLNRRQRKYICTVCHDVCPRDVFSLDPGKELDWNKCIGCGICVSQCPTRSFAPGSTLQRYYTEEMDLKQPVSFSCYRETQLCTKTVECLAGVPWELLAYLALYTDVVLHIGSCASCEDPKRRESLAENLRLLREFLGEETYCRRVHVLTEGVFRSPAEKPTEEDREVSRREIFSDAKKTVVRSIYKAAATRLPYLTDVQESGLQYRELLAKAVLRRREILLSTAAQQTPGQEEEHKLPVYGVRLPAYTSACYGCGICEKVCPQKALEIGPEENGRRLIFVTPWKCTACGQCVRVCPHGGMAEMRSIPVPYLNKLPLVRIGSESCEKCGTPVRPGTLPRLCPACRNKYGRTRSYE